MSDNQGVLVCVCVCVLEKQLACSARSMPAIHMLVSYGWRCYVYLYRTPMSIILHTASIIGFTCIVNVMRTHLLAHIQVHKV